MSQRRCWVPKHLLGILCPNETLYTQGALYAQLGGRYYEAHSSKRFFNVPIQLTSIGRNAGVLTNVLAHLFMHFSNYR